MNACLAERAVGEVARRRTSSVEVAAQAVDAALAARRARASRAAPSLAVGRLVDEQVVARLGPRREDLRAQERRHQRGAPPAAPAGRRRS